MGFNRGCFGGADDSLLFFFLLLVLLFCGFGNGLLGGVFDDDCRKC